MKKFSISILIAVAIGLSCESKKQEEQQVKNVENKPFIFNMAHYFLDEEFNLAFPIWFNDSIVCSNKIQEIKRTIYNSFSKEDTLKTLDEIQYYQFNEEGIIQSLIIAHYYDNQLMGEMTYEFNNIDQYGFTEVIAATDVHNDEEQEILESYQIHNKETYKDKYLVYSKDDGNYLFYMLEEKNWGALSVDSILKPSREDRIVLGTPQKPIKKYRVSNKVNEFDVVEYQYQLESISKINYEKYPFSYHRTILYNEHRNCIGFVDSTFSDDRYLNRRESMFHFESELPVRLIHESKSENSEVGYFQFETFDYKFFEIEKEEE